MVRQQWYRRVLSITSQTLNVWFLNGHPDESISARAFRRGHLEVDYKWARVQRAIDRLFSPFEKDHCKGAFMTDLLRSLDYVDYMKVTHYAG